MASSFSCSSAEGATTPRSPKDPAHFPSEHLETTLPKEDFKALVLWSTQMADPSTSPILRSNRFAMRFLYSVMKGAHYVGSDTYLETCSSS